MLYQLIVIVVHIQNILISTSHINMSNEYQNGQYVEYPYLIVHSCYKIIMR